MGQRWHKCGHGSRLAGQMPSGGKVLAGVARSGGGSDLAGNRPGEFRFAPGRPLLPEPRESPIPPQETLPPLRSHSPVHGDDDEATRPARDPDGAGALAKPSAHPFPGVDVATGEPERRGSAGGSLRTALALRSSVRSIRRHGGVRVADPVTGTVTPIGRGAGMHASCLDGQSAPSVSRRGMAE